ncbi:alpha/beta-hydrolase [Thozetella sp. PMI_491]|nr:alpha/beta-hydrolase [Thozetella sp. PMI_491]
MSNIPNVQGIPITLSDPKDDQGCEGQRPAPQRRLKKAVDKTGEPPSRFSLRVQAGWWRSMEYLGMSLHFLAPPQPPNPTFTRTIPSTLSKEKGKFVLHFYTPKGYEKAEQGTRYPAVVNFHGGGFTIGAATDDARFARVVLEQCRAVFVSVEYRLAPEYPFPTAVEDGADALLYLIRNATDLHIDTMRLATSGFSAGGNICITAPLRLASYLKSGASIPKHKIVAVAPWYPITDYTLTRAGRREVTINPKKALPTFFTDLFDASYLYPPDLDLANPLLSPSKASDEQLAEGLPQNVIFHTCEWDMLLREGEQLATRLGQPPLSKKVHYTMIPGVSHGWDKGPNPIQPAERSEELYLECCKRLNDAFEGK